LLESLYIRSVDNNKLKQIIMTAQDIAENGLQIFQVYNTDKIFQLLEEELIDDLYVPADLDLLPLLDDELKMQNRDKIIYS
jgi:hypothetical protein